MTTGTPTLLTTHFASCVPREKVFIVYSQYGTVAFSNVKLWKDHLMIDSGDKHLITRWHSRIELLLTSPYPAESNADDNPQGPIVCLIGDRGFAYH